MPKWRKGRGPTLEYRSYSTDFKQTKGNSQLLFALSISLSLSKTHVVYTGVGHRQWREDQQAGKLLECWGEIKVLCFHYRCTLKIEPRDYEERMEKKKHRYTFIYCRLYLDTHVECTCVAWEQIPQQKGDSSTLDSSNLQWLSNGFASRPIIYRRSSGDTLLKLFTALRQNKNGLNLNLT